MAKSACPECGGNNGKKLSQIVEMGKSSLMEMNYIVSEKCKGY